MLGPGQEAEFRVHHLLYYIIYIYHIICWILSVTVGSVKGQAVVGLGQIGEQIEGLKLK